MLLFPDTTISYTLTHSNCCSCNRTDTQCCILENVYWFCNLCGDILSLFHSTSSKQRQPKYSLSAKHLTGHPDAHVIGSFCSATSTMRRKHGQRKWPVPPKSFNLKSVTSFTFDCPDNILLLGWRPIQGVLLLLDHHPRDLHQQWAAVKRKWLEQ